MGNNNYFNCKHFLQMKDKNGEYPEAFFIVSRVRGVGKTTSIGLTLLNIFFNGGSEGVVDLPLTGYKMCLYVREAKCLGNFAPGILKGTVDMYYPGWTVEEKTGIKGVFNYIYLVKGKDEEKESVEVGYVINIKNVRNVKEVSSTFVDVGICFFDEFQDATGKYLADEVSKFLDVHTSIARGSGEQRRYLPCIFASNTLSIMNPYFQECGLTRNLQANTRKYRGDGYVYLRFENKELAQVHALSGMGRAFAGNKTIDYMDDSWMLDNETGICSPDGWGRSYYVATLINDNRTYSVQYYQYSDIYYISTKVDETYPIRYTITVDGSPNQALKASVCYRHIIEAIAKGKMRFDSLESKRICLEMIY